MSTPLPSASAEIAELKALRQELGAASVSNVNLKTFKARAELLSARLGSPVRVAVLGHPRSGKSSLVNFMVGANLLPTDEGAHASTPVIIRYGDSEQTVVGWWSGIEIVEDGLRLEMAAMHNPDFIEFRIANPILKFMSFMDMPSEQESVKQAGQIVWVSSRADVIIWCSKSSKHTDWDQKTLLPFANRLRGRSLLAMTHADKLSPSERTDLMDRLGMETSNLITSVIPVSTTDAINAAPGGSVTDPQAWEKSGGKDLAMGVLSLARKVRISEMAEALQLVKQARAELKSELGTDAADEAPASSKPVAEVKEVGKDAGAGAEKRPEAPPPVASEKPKPAAASAAKEVVSHAPETGALRVMQDRLDELVAYCEDDAEFRAWGFLNMIVEIADDISNAAAPRDSLIPEAAWLRSQIDDAFGEFNMMQMGGEDAHCMAAARLLLQLSRDLSWAASRSAGA